MKTRYSGRDRTIHPASLGLTTAEIEKIIDDVAEETARMEKENRGRFCCTCGAPLPRKYDVPTECDECLKDLAIPEFLKHG